MNHAFLAAIVSGVAVFVNGYGVTRFADATVYTTAKNVVAALVLLGVVAAVRRGAHRTAGSRVPLLPASARDRAALLLVGVIGGGIAFVLFFEGLARASSTDAAFIHKTLVVWVALLAVPLLGERLRPVHLLAIALLVAGQVLLTGDLVALRPGTGEALILGATLLWSVEVIVVKRVLGTTSPPVLAAARMAVGSVALLGWLAVTGRVDALAGLSLAGATWAIATGVLLAAYVLCWYGALARLPAVDVTAVLVGGAIITALLDLLVEQATLRPDLPGLLLLAAGVAAVALGRGRRAPGLQEELAR